MALEQQSGPDPLEVARARRAELRASMLDLEHSLAAPAPGRLDDWLARVRACLDALAADFREHIEITEGPTGLYRDILATAPRLAGAVRRLEREHGDITVALDTICTLIDKVPQDRGAEDVREGATAVLTALVRHRQRGADLVWEAYASDIGGET
jgi:hypothetical protein